MKLRMKVKDLRCENCRLFQREAGNSSRYGVCHRNPPVFLRFDDYGDPVMGQPVVSQEDWCGEFKPKESA
jgi:hypothetical protein